MSMSPYVYLYVNADSSTQFLKGLQGEELKEIPHVTELLGDLHDEVYLLTLNFNL